MSWSYAYVSICILFYFSIFIIATWTNHLPVCNWADEWVGNKLNYGFGRKHHANDYRSVSEKLMPGHWHRNSVGLSHIALGPTLWLNRNILTNVRARRWWGVSLSKFLEIFHEALWLCFIRCWCGVVADRLDYGRFGHIDHNTPCLVHDYVFTLNLI